MAELKLRKCKAIILKSVFTGEACCVCVCVCVCVSGGESFKLLEPVGTGGEKERKNIFMGITKCHSEEFQKLFK